MTYGECLLGVEAGGKAVQFNDYEFLFARDYLTTGRSRLTKETHEVYGDKGGVLRTTKEYTYASDYHKLVSGVKETASDGSEIVTKYYYPHDYSSTVNAALQTMKDKHILLPVDVRSYKGGRLVSGEQTSTMHTVSRRLLTVRKPRLRILISTRIPLSHSQLTCGVRMMPTGCLYPRKHVRMA